MKKAILLSITLAALADARAVGAQPESQSTTSGTLNAETIREELSQILTPAQRIELRFRRQNQRINRGMREGTITSEQGTDLREKLDALYGQYQKSVQATNGVPNQELITQTENGLNQMHQSISALEGAGKSVPQGQKVLGPNWTAGRDGAQKPALLLQQMKQEARRELRQERQATEQKVEQQQLDYEKQMIPALGTQKQSIIQQKNDLQDIRKEQGAN